MHCKNNIYFDNVAIVKNGTSNIYEVITSKYEAEVFSVEELRMSYPIDNRTGKKIETPKDLNFKEFKISI